MRIAGPYAYRSPDRTNPYPYLSDCYLARRCITQYGTGHIDFVSYQFGNYNASFGALTVISTNQGAAMQWLDTQIENAGYTIVSQEQFDKYLVLL